MLSLVNRLLKVIAYEIYLFFGVNDEISIKLVSLRYVLVFFVHNPKTLKILTSKVIKNLYTILLDAYL